MSLKGSLRTMPIEDLLDWIDRRFACGSLTVERGSVTRSFHFDSGYITNASSDDPTEHLGQLLIKRGMVDAKALNEAYRVQADTGVLLGKILLMVGAIDEAALEQTLEVKLFEALCDAMSWGEGTFVFEPTPSSEVLSEYEVSVNLREVIEAGRVRAERWRVIRRHLETDDTYLWLKDLSVRSDFAPESVEWALLQLIDRGYSVGDIVMECAGTRFATCDALTALIETGKVSIDKRRMKRLPTAEMTVDDLRDAAQGRADGGDRTGAYELARKALDKDPDNESVVRLTKELERSVFAELSRTMLTSFRVPKLLKSKQELETLEMDKAERYLTQRIDGHWDLLSLMRISPLREVEVLLTCKRLADRGIISL